MSHVRWFGALGTFALVAGVGSTRERATDQDGVRDRDGESQLDAAGESSSPARSSRSFRIRTRRSSTVSSTARRTQSSTAPLVHISEQVAYATNYHNVLATPSGNNPHIHPSEPNYLWAEAGTNFGVFNDNDPFATKGPTNQDTDQHLSSLLMAAGRTWRSYQEDIDLTRNRPPGSSPTSRSRGICGPFRSRSFSGNFAPGFVNDFNLANQFNYAAKHNPQVFFTDTNGGNDATPANPLSSSTRRCSSCSRTSPTIDVAEYNWITPNQYNDMHTALTGGYKGLTGDAANIKQGDDFLSQIIPAIMASNAYKNHGAIIIWFDESEAGRRRRQSRRFRSHHRRDRHLSARARERRGPSLRQHRLLHAFLRFAHDAGDLPRRAASR